MGKSKHTSESIEMLVSDDRVYHCALDDTINVLEEINQKADDLRSIFDVEVMAILKQFHEQYGTKFSLYLFYEKLAGFNLSQMTDKFAGQWQENRHFIDCVRAGVRTQCDFTDAAKTGELAERILRYKSE